ncbi:MAG TPA: LacI family DNA-binding transcriptional regulator [Chloroflexia bacterium]|nr:LacI family DNA-binding transcriptional regulator [Chloroflexia bacterium]
MAITIQDVAREAGVGVGTVSRVINNSPAVKPATREKVQAAIERLKYSPDPIARSMIARRTDSLGVIVPFFTRPFSIEVLRGIQVASTQLNRELIIYNVETDEQRELYYSRLPMRRKVDGLLVISLPMDDRTAQSLLSEGIPTVLIDSYNAFLTSVVVNNVEGAYQAVKCLLRNGHRRIGFINGIIEGHFKFNVANDRLIGVHRAFGEAGIPFEPELMATAEWNREGGRRAALELLQLPKPPTAIFAASDIQAVGVLEAARSLNVSIPEQLSLIGFDGIELSDILELSTMQQPMQQMGELGVARVMEQIENPGKAPELIRFEAHLLERRTVAPLNVYKPTKLPA